MSLYDEDGIDGPFERHMRAAEREDAKRAQTSNRKATIRLLEEWIWGAGEAWRRAARDEECGLLITGERNDARARTWLDAACGLARQAGLFDAPELLDLRLYSAWCAEEYDAYRRWIERTATTEAA